MSPPGIFVVDSGFARRAGARTAQRIGQLVPLVYSRVDADGSLREARVTPAR